MENSLKCIQIYLMYKNLFSEQSIYLVAEISSNYLRENVAIEEAAEQEPLQRLGPLELLRLRRELVVGDGDDLLSGHGVCGTLRPHPTLIAALLCRILRHAN